MAVRIDHGFPAIEGMTLLTINSTTAIYVMSLDVVYKVINTGEPYVEQEYPTGGYIISYHDKERDGWDFITISPDTDRLKECLIAFRHNKVKKQFGIISL